MKQKTVKRTEDLRVMRNKLANLESLLGTLRAKNHVSTVNSEEFIRKNYGIPATLGTTEEARIALDKALTGGVGFDSLLGSLQSHAIDMGQFPVTSFVGYGALQQIAQNGMIRNCIKTVADDCTREWITIKGGEDTDLKKIEELQDVQARRYNLQKIFNDAICKVGFMGGAFIFIRTNPASGEDPDLTLPLRVNSKSAEIQRGDNVGFVVVDPVNVAPCTYNATDPLRSDYMTPDKWLVLGRPVHASRLLTLYTNEPPTLLKPAYNFLGIPQAQILWDYVAHWNECRVSAQELVKKLSLLIYYTDMQSRMGSYGGVQELDGIMQVLQHYRTNNSVFVADKESDHVDNVQTSVSGVQDIIRQAQEMIAAINRTPAVKLFGISPSGFNATGESDIRNYNDHIRSQQELFRPAIQKCLDVMQLTLWGEIDRSITFDFNELNLDNESAQATNFNSRVTALATLADRQAISPEEVRQAVRMDDSARLHFLPEELPDMPDDMEHMQGNGEEGEQGDGLEGVLSQYADLFGAKKNPKEVKHETETQNGETDLGERWDSGEAHEDANKI